MDGFLDRSSLPQTREEAVPDAYAHVMKALQAGGVKFAEADKVLTALRSHLNISNDEHLAIGERISRDVEVAALSKGRLPPNMAASSRPAPGSNAVPMARGASARRQHMTQQQLQQQRSPSAAAAQQQQQQQQHHLAGMHQSSVWPGNKGRSAPTMNGNSAQFNANQAGAAPAALRGGSMKRPAPGSNAASSASRAVARGSGAVTSGAPGVAREIPLGAMPNLDNRGNKGTPHRGAALGTYVLIEENVSARPPTTSSGPAAGATAPTGKGKGGGKGKASKREKLEAACPPEIIDLLANGDLQGLVIERYWDVEGWCEGIIAHSVPRGQSQAHHIVYDLDKGNPSWELGVSLWAAQANQRWRIPSPARWNKRDWSLIVPPEKTKKGKKRPASASGSAASASAAFAASAAAAQPAAAAAGVTAASAGTLPPAQRRQRVSSNGRPPQLPIAPLAPMGAGRGASANGTVPPLISQVAELQVLPEETVLGILQQAESTGNVSEAETLLRKVRHQRKLVLEALAQTTICEAKVLRKERTRLLSDLARDLEVCRGKMHVVEKELHALAQ